MKECIMCGKEIKPNQGYYSTEDGPVCSDKCHTEHYWCEIVDNPEGRVIVNGRCYYIGDENDFSKGFGGRLFVIKFFDGRIVETTNLRLNDDVPEGLRHILTDNAEFI